MSPNSWACTFYFEKGWWLCMSRNPELDSLKQREEAAFWRKQEVFQRCKEAKDRASTSYDAMQSAWKERCFAREEMNREFEAMQRANDNYRKVWDEYGRIRDYNNSRIESLRHEADREHEMMKDCFDQASAAYEYGSKAEAPIYASEGHKHKDRRDELNEEVKALIQKIQDAKANAKYYAPKIDSSAFHSAKERFESAKSRHKSAQAEFKSLKTECGSMKAEFNSAQKEHIRLKEEFQRKLEEVKENNKRERERTLDKAGVRWSERDDAKIVKKADGTTQVYHGGIGKGDGYGHGHTALDQFGNKTYERDAFKEHGKQNYTEEKTGNWTKLERGIIGDDHEVTFALGVGKRSGQTLIADGLLNKREFRAGHNHYGDNDKSRFPDEPSRIEDSSRHKNDNHYTGPGH